MKILCQVNIYWQYKYIFCVYLYIYINMNIICNSISHSRFVWFSYLCGWKYIYLSIYSCVYNGGKKGKEFEKRKVKRSREEKHTGTKYIIYIYRWLDHKPCTKLRAPGENQRETIINMIEASFVSPATFKTLFI